MRRFPALFALALVISAGACAKKTATAAGGSAPTARRDPSVMDSTQLRGSDFTSGYDAVMRLHADWLLPRGGPANGRVPELGVWIEGQIRSRGVDFLKTLRPADVKQVRRLSITESTNSYSWPWGGLVITTRY